MDVRRYIAMGSLAACGIFHASLEDNLACATPEAVTQTEAREAAEAVGLHEWAQNLPVRLGRPSLSPIMLIHYK